MHALGHDGTYAGPWPLPNAWIGASVENQDAANERRAPLQALAEQGWNTWVSNEPAVGPVDWSGWEFIRWLVSGGESGYGAEPSHPDWLRMARDWAARNGIPFYAKQWGEWGEPESIEKTGVAHTGWWEDAPEDGGVARRGFGERDVDEIVYRVGKRAAGHFLDGQEHLAYPEGLR